MASHDDIQQIKDRLNIVDVVGQYVQLKRAGRTYSARCPFHKERTPSFHVSPERGTYICFGCGEKGDIFSFVERLEGVDFKTALTELAKRAGVELHHTFTPSAQNTDQDERLRAVCEAAAVYYQSILATRHDVHEYLRARAVSDETLSQWRLGYAPASWRAVSEHLAALGFSSEEIVAAGLAAQSQRHAGEIYDRFRGRIMFPLCDAQGRVVAFSGRYFEKVEGSHEEGEPAKYVNSPETPLFKKSRVLYGFDKAKSAIRKLDCVLLVEGQFDLILAHQSGLPFTVALSGTALTPEHLSLLSRLTKRLVLALDADAAGVRSGLKSALMALGMGFDVKIPTFPPGKDPADVAKENPELLKQAVRTSQTAVEFFLTMLKQTARDERSYKKLVEAQVLPLIGAMQSKIEQEHFIGVVANRLGVSESAVREEVAKRKINVSDVAKLEEVASAEVAPEALPPDPLEKKIAMLLFYFPEHSAVRTKLAGLVGERLADLTARLGGTAEEWRFRFEREVVEGTSEEAIAADMLADIERAVAKERFKMKFL